MYKGFEYEIHVPPNKTIGQSVSAMYEEVESVDFNKIDFDVINFASGIEIDDEAVISGPQNVDKVGTEPPNIGGMETIPEYPLIHREVKSNTTAATHLAIAIFSSFFNSITNTYINFRFEKVKGGESRRVIIKVGSSDYNNLIQQYAHGGNISIYWAQDSALNKAMVSTSAANLYSELTGVNLSNDNRTFDVEVTLDSGHKNDPYVSYLWINKNGEIMEYPKLYPKDKIEIGYRYNLNFDFKALCRIDLDVSTVASDIFKELFKKIL